LPLPRIHYSKYPLLAHREKNYLSSFSSSDVPAPRSFWSDYLFATLSVSALSYGMVYQQQPRNA
jgi:hypothetical protein